MLVAFEAVVRRGTITAAAGELKTSQPAVSQQIHALEEALGVKLFRRAGRTLEPTAEALSFAEAVTASLNALAEAAQALRPPAGRARRFVLSAPFGFAYLWLEPLLPKLEETFPDLGLVVRAEDDFKSAAQKNPDMEIRFGPASSAASGVHFLMHEIVQPVCSPAFAQRHELSQQTATPERLSRLPLLHLDEGDPRWCNWPAWFAANDVRGFRPSPRLYHNNYPLLQQAAASGKGMALGWHGLMDPLLASGELVALGPVYVRREWGYSLHLGNRSSAPLRDVAAWMAEQARPGALRLLERYG